MRAQLVPYSSIVGGGVILTDNNGTYVGQLTLLNFMPGLEGDERRAQYQALCQELVEMVNGERVRHVKRGREAEVLHRGVELQIAVGTGFSPSGNCLHEGDRLVVYQEADGKLWAREENEFDDGRFVPIKEKS